MVSLQRTARTALQGFQKQKQKMKGIYQDSLPFAFNKTKRALGINQARIPFALQKKQRIKQMVRKLKAKKASRLQIRRW